MQNEQPFGKLLSDTSKPEVKAVANVDKLLRKPFSRASKAQAKTEQKGDAPAADRLHNVEHKTLHQTQLVLPVPDPLPFSRALSRSLAVSRARSLSLMHTHKHVQGIPWAHKEGTIGDGVKTVNGENVDMGKKYQFPDARWTRVALRS